MRASTLLLPLLTVTAARADRVLEPPKRAWPTALAIVVDEATWHSARAEIEAYRSAVESDGLGTWLAIDAWGRPVRARSHHHYEGSPPFPMAHYRIQHHPFCGKLP